MKFFKHRGCYGLQLLRIRNYTVSFWIVPRNTKLMPHSHPNQVVYIIPLFCIRTTFNRCPENTFGLFPGKVETFRAWPFKCYVTPNGYVHFANKSHETKPRIGPFIFINIIKWIDGNVKLPKDGYRLAPISL
jgi:hypothetical protein